MKSHVALLGMVLADASAGCAASTPADYDFGLGRDLKTISRRVGTEGESFLTITLPNFGRSLEQALDLGQVAPSHFQGFRKRGAIPSFGRGMLGLVFDKDTGTLLDNPCLEAIQGLRQVSYLFKKIEVPCADWRTTNAFRTFVKTDQSVQDSRLSKGDPLLVDFKRVSRLLFGHMLSELDREVYNGRVVPKHGPGSTSQRILGNAKYQQKVWTERLEEVFPAMDYLYASPRHYFDAIEDGVGPVWLDPGNEPPVRVVAVPKTLEKPRIIAIEPVHTQYVQQGLMEMFLEKLERNDTLLRQLIGFKDQDYSRDLVLRGSAGPNPSIATLDLSEASDRVSIQHVETLLGDYDWLCRSVFACRSSKAEVPGYGIRTLAKYASMGSALTFPLEAMVFTTLVFLGIENARGYRFTNRSQFRDFVGSVRIYGDDIIVPVEFAGSVVKSLEDFGLKVNPHKSFWNGMFRESCGMDAYDGHDVTVVKLTRPLPTLREHAEGIISAVSFRNHMYNRGYWHTARFLDELIGKLIPFPSVWETSPALGRHSFLGYETQRECPHLQRPLVKAAVVDALIPKSPLQDQEALLKFFLKRGDEPIFGKHLERAGRPDAVRIKLSG